MKYVCRDAIPDADKAACHDMCFEACHRGSFSGSGALGQGQLPWGEAACYVLLAIGGWRRLRKAGYLSAGPDLALRPLLSTAYCRFGMAIAPLPQ